MGKFKKKRKEINNKAEMAYKRHAEQIELVKEKAAAVIKHSKVKKNYNVI